MTLVQGSPGAERAHDAVDALPWDGLDAADDWAWPGSFACGARVQVGEGEDVGSVGSDATHGCWGDSGGHFDGVGVVEVEVVESRS